TVTLSNPTNATIAVAQATGTIDDDDPTPTVSLTLSGDPLVEQGGVATVTATLSAVSGRDVVVALGFGGAAPADADYSRSATSITIPAGVSSGSIAITAIDDLLMEGPETITVEITGVTNGTEVGTQLVTATIADDDPANFRYDFGTASSPVAA